MMDSQWCRGLMMDVLGGQGVDRQSNSPANQRQMHRVVVVRL